MTPRILIIDDERTFREFLGEALEAEGYQVEHAASARAGLACAARTLPQVILLDKNLPDRSGLEILPELRGLTAKPVVIMLTAFAEPVSAVQALRTGAFHYLSKPFEFSDLHRVLAGG